MIAQAAEWPLRRRELLDLVVDLEYGGLPPAPDETVTEPLHEHTLAAFDHARHAQYRIATGPAPACTFVLDLTIPPGAGPFPVVLTGDGCWRYVTEAVTQAVLRRGCILAVFNRCEIAPDVGSSDRTTGVYRTCAGGACGALAAWAWGIQRAVDALQGMSCVESGRIAVVGHSRGGKAALLAGATDERIAVTCANGSGCGGAGSFRWRGPGSERLADILRVFPYWFGPRLQAYAGREDELPFDQHSLAALLAPRALIFTEALGDHWANPGGAWQTFLGAREAYRFLGAEPRLGIAYREGVHEHTLEDWNVFLDFMEAQARGGGRRICRAPEAFRQLPPAFSWSAPGFSPAVA